MEGRPPGEAYAHQRWDELVNGYRGFAGADGQVSHPHQPVGFVMSIGQVTPGVSYNLANNWPAQDPSKVWTFNEGRFQRGAHFVLEAAVSLRGLFLLLLQAVDLGPGLIEFGFRRFRFRRVLCHRLADFGQRRAGFLFAPRHRRHIRRRRNVHHRRHHQAAAARADEPHSRS